MLTILRRQCAYIPMDKFSEKDVLWPQKVTGPSIFYYIYWKTSIKRGKTV